MRGYAYAIAGLGLLWPGLVQADECARAEFEAVVDQASSTLVGITQKNTPVFQGKLRQLKDKRGWSHADFMSQGAPLVRDSTIAGFDATSEDLLNKINTQGSTGADCAMLNELKASMTALVDAQNAKWVYMFGKIESELAK
jgi:hypothetical protein